ncbi:putative polysaccharide biosynthesis protein [Knoellia remsis]|uniref:Putative polysaccharide biosynthesis protein n=1 Tax=Knoellia remsis TaxID=407159 RepID=A0A2T0V0P5_9MICO|nr:polysaccharide biosynthesis C-terminal domain-containing protein [Knoellia remsis]PRY63677.1 putative polysaccharide biosynthesis protein [Knoellia remsis]
MAAYDIYPASTVTSTATASAGAGLAAAPGASQAPPPLDDTGAATTRADRHPLPQGRTPRHFSAAPLVLVDLLVPALLLVTGSGRALAAVSLALGTTLVHRWLGLYRRRLTENALDDLPYLAVGVLVGASAVAVIAEVVDPLELRHLWAVALVMLACIVLGRSQVYAHHRRQRRRPGGQVRLLVVGEGEAAQELSRRVANNRDQGIELVGYVGSHRTREDATLTPLVSPDPIVLRASAVALGLNLALNMLLIPRFGAVAAAATTTLAYLAQALVAMRGLRRELRPDGVRRSLLVAGAATLLSAVVLVLPLPALVAVGLGGMTYAAAWWLASSRFDPVSSGFVRNAMGRTA